MAPNPRAPEAGSTGAAPFVTTHWSLVVRAGSPDPAEASKALAELCQAYWYPLYAFIRRQGYNPQDAEDRAQEFFSRLVEKNFVAEASQQKGRFRSFLLTAAKRHLANEWDRQHAQKRGGFQSVVSIDQAAAESRLAAELQHNLQPDVLFERHWAMTLLDRVMARLQQEYAATGRAALFDHLRNCLLQDESALPYAEIAERLKITLPAVKVAAHRLRARYRQLLREEIARTVDSPDKVESEIAHLFKMFE